MQTLTISKTIRLDPKTFTHVQDAAEIAGITTSAYIRDLVNNAIANTNTEDDIQR